MSLDFTLGKYTDLCEAIAFSGYVPMTVRDYLEARELPSRLVVMRHDVDVVPKNEPKMALIENDFGIRATYYFRYKRGVFEPDVMRQIAAMGHEIGYHYETLDKARGDSQKALEIFASELTSFRDVVEVETISMHGNPLTRWDNRDLWRSHSFKDFGISGEAYLSFDRSKIAYLSDTGRTWGPEFKMKDWLPPKPGSNEPPCAVPRIRTTDDLIAMVRSHRCDRLYLNTHAGRWADGTFDWTGQFIEDQLVNLVKRALALKRRIGGNTR